MSFYKYSLLLEADPLTPNTTPETPNQATPEENPTDIGGATGGDLGLGGAGGGASLGGGLGLGGGGGGGGDLGMGGGGQVDPNAQPIPIKKITIADVWKNLNSISSSDNYNDFFTKININKK